MLLLKKVVIVVHTPNIRLITRCNTYHNKQQGTKYKALADERKEEERERKKLINYWELVAMPEKQND